MPYRIWEIVRENDSETEFKCRVLASPKYERLSKTARPTSRDLPEYHRRKLAEELKLDEQNIDDWAKDIQIDDEKDYGGNRYVAFVVTVENIWLNARGEWRWQHQFWASDDAYLVYKSYGWKCSRGILNKVRCNSITTSDIPAHAGRALAAELNLPWNEFQYWALIEKCAETDDGFEITVKIPKVWLNSTTQWDWESDGYAHDRDYAVYKSRGIACSSQLLNRINGHMPLTPALIPSDARRKLADKVGLDYAEFERGAQDIQIRVTDHALWVYVNVPNVWICADLLRGGNWYTDHPLVNVGGSIGQLATDVFVINKKVVKCRTFRDLMDALGKNSRCLWGMVVYAHGGKVGNMAHNNEHEMPDEDKYYDGDILRARTGFSQFNQQLIINEVRKIGYKLAEIHMRQCDSGHNGSFISEIKYNLKLVPWKDLSTRDKELERKYYVSEYKKRAPNMGVVDSYVTSKGISMKLTAKWDTVWKQLGVKVTTYDGVNAGGIDWGFIGWN